MPFVLCSKCRRHIKHREETCPFCGESMKGHALPRGPAAAALVIGLGLASFDCAYGPAPEYGDAGVADSSHPDTTQSDATASDLGAVDSTLEDTQDSIVQPDALAAYAPPPLDMGVVDSSQSDTREVGIMPAYGPPAGFGG